MKKSQILVRPMKPEEAPIVVEQIKGNIEDSERINYPLAKVYCAQNGKPVTFALTHPVLVVESLAPAPTAESGEKALAARELLNAMSAIAASQGIGDLLVMFGPQDHALKKMAERRGFEKVKWEVYRRKTNG